MPTPAACHGPIALRQQHTEFATKLNRQIYGSSFRRLQLVCAGMTSWRQNSFRWCTIIIIIIFRSLFFDCIFLMCCVKLENAWKRNDDFYSAAQKMHAHAFQPILVAVFFLICFLLLLLLPRFSTMIYLWVLTVCMRVNCSFFRASSRLTMQVVQFLAKGNSLRLLLKMDEFIMALGEIYDLDKNDIFFFFFVAKTNINIVPITKSSKSNVRIMICQVTVCN